MNKEAFISSCKNVSKPRKHTATHSFGTFDFYNDYKKEAKKNSAEVIPYLLFSKIVFAINKGIALNLAIGNSVNLMCGLGILEVRKRDISPSIDENGNLKLTSPVNWQATLDLWYEDDEARLDKTLVRIEDPYVYKISWNRSKSKFVNQSYFKLKRCRSLKLLIKEGINNKQIKDAYLIFKKNGI